jgi:pilus assembly protein CpaE
VTLLCDFDDETAAAIAPQLDPPVRFAASLPEAAVALVRAPEEHVVVISQVAPLDQVLDFAVAVRTEHPAIGVILVRNSHDPAAVSAALEAGVRDIVLAGDTDRLVDACRRAAAVPALTRERPLGSDDLVPGIYSPDLETGEASPTPAPDQPPTPGKVVTVFSPKGGSGKTTISTNLAVALNAAGGRVCLIDLDLEFGDVAISLSLTPARTLVDAVTTEVEGDEDDALALLTTAYRPGLDCILAPIEPGDASKIPADLITDLLALLRTRYDYVVVDTPSQLSENVLTALDASDHQVLLLNPELPSLKNLRLTLDMLDLLHYGHQRRSVIFNRADSAAGLSAAEVEEILRFPIAKHVPASRDVPASINRGVPIVAANPNHAVSTAIRKFADEVIVGGAVSGKKRGRRGGLFRRRSA